MKIPSTSNDQAERQRFVEEGYLLQQLNHPNIVAVEERTESLGTSHPYIVMEYCRGGDLRQAIDARKALGYAIRLKAYSIGAFQLGLTQRLGVLGISWRKAKSWRSSYRCYFHCISATQEHLEDSRSYIEILSQRTVGVLWSALVSCKF